MDKGRKIHVAFWVLIQALQEHEKPQESHQTVPDSNRWCTSRKEGECFINIATSFWRKEKRQLSIITYRYSIPRNEIMCNPEFYQIYLSSLVKANGYLPWLLASKFYHRKRQPVFQFWKGTSGIFWLAVGFSAWCWS